MMSKPERLVCVIVLVAVVGGALAFAAKEASPVWEEIKLANDAQQPKPQGPMRRFLPLPEPTVQTIKVDVMVNYAIDDKDLLDGGGYELASPSFYKKFFPKAKHEQGEKMVELLCFQFHQRIDSMEFVAETIVEEKCRPATFRELLALLRVLRKDPKLFRSVGEVVIPQRFANERGEKILLGSVFLLAEPACDGEAEKCRFALRNSATQEALRTYKSFLAVRE